MSERDLLRLDVGEGPLRAEHQRLIRTALRRGHDDPEAALAEGALEGSYPAPVLGVAIRTWQARMVHEHHSAAVFSRLLPFLMEAGATLEFKSTVLRMSMDELRHAKLCAGVVELLGGTPEVETDLRTQPLPAHEDGTPLEAALRNVMFVGCFSETVSVSLLSEERELTTEPVIRSVVSQLASDEILHAKLGWSFLAQTWPQLDESARMRMNAYLPGAFGYLEARMHAAMPVPEGPPAPDAVRAQLEALGCMDPEDGRAIFAATVEEVIVPRLEDHGLAARKAWDERQSPASRV